MGKLGKIAIQSVTSINYDSTYRNVFVYIYLYDLYIDSFETEHARIICGIY